MKTDGTKVEARRAATDVRQLAGQVKDGYMRLGMIQETRIALQRLEAAMREAGDTVVHVPTFDLGTGK